MMKRVLVCLALLATVSTVYGVGIYPLTNGNDDSKYSTATDVARGNSGELYISGATRATGATANRAAYWSFSGGTVSAANVLPANSGASVASLANGIGQLANGDIVVSANLTGGVSDWSSAGNGSGGNGWQVRYWTGTSQASNGGGFGNQLTVKPGGTNFYTLGKNASSATSGCSYDIDGATRSAVQDQWSLQYGGSTSAGGSVQQISENGIAVGELRAKFGTYTGSRRAYIHDSLGVYMLPGDSSNPEQRAQGAGISADGKTAVGYGRWTSSDAWEYPMYWTESGGIWTYHRLGIHSNSTGSSFVFCANDDGSLIGGTQYQDAASPAGVERAAFWDVNILDDSNRPKATILATWLSDHGVDMTGWTNLTRIYSMAKVGDVTYMTGFGTFNDGVNPAYTRGFLVAIPEPATLSFLALGALAMLRRRR